LEFSEPSSSDGAVVGEGDGDDEGSVVGVGDGEAVGSAVGLGDGAGVASDDSGGAATAAGPTTTNADTTTRWMMSRGRVMSPRASVKEFLGSIYEGRSASNVIGSAIANRVKFTGYLKRVSTSGNEC
jgi:hypothetical protein